MEDMPSINMEETQDSQSLMEITPSSSGDLPEHRPFPFMQLPLEIRTMIFKSFVTQSKRVRVSSWKPHFPSASDESTPQDSVCNIFLVSKAFYREAAPLYYHLNLFHFPRLEDVLLLKTLAPDNRRAIKSISVDYVGQSPAKAFAFLQTCVGLRQLRITFSNGQYRVWCHIGADFEPEKITGFRAMAKIRGLTHLGIGIYTPGDRDMGMFVLQIQDALSRLLEPHDPAFITRLDKKDYPDKNHRSVFGKANVATRMEHKVMGTKPQLALDC